MKELLSNKEDFRKWREHYFNYIMDSYDECEPKEYPCVVVYRTFEGEYCLRNLEDNYYARKRVDYEFVYLNNKSL